MALFIWGYWRYDVVALIALALSIAIGAVPFHKAYTGLSNPAVITVACVMVISAAINHSGSLRFLIRKINFENKSTILHVGALTLISAILSAFMNNVGALTLMMPIAIQTAIKSKRSPSLVLMPIALGSALGGLTTVIGTPPNLLISSYRQRITGNPFAMFDFAHVGLYVAIAGIIFIMLIAWRLIPSKRKAATRQEDLFQVQDYITELKISKDSPLIGKTVKEVEKMIKADCIAGIIRDERKRLVVQGFFVLEENDILIVEANPEDLQELIEAGKLELISEHPLSSEELSSPEVGLLEAVVPQGSRIERRSAKRLNLRSRYNINLLGIAREGKAFKKRITDVNLRAGDVVLLQGRSEGLVENVASIGFLPLVERGLSIGLNRRAFLPLLIFLIAIALAMFRVLPVEIAFAGAVLAMVVLRLIPTRLIYDSIDWPIIILLAAMIPIGNALQTTGGTALIVHVLIALTKSLSPMYILALLLIITMTLSDFMNNAATAVVMAPIAASIAQSLHVSVDPFLMAVAIGASCSFLTPVGHQNNTLVMGPGGYKFSDYIKVGLPLEILIVIIAVPLILHAWPLGV